MLKALELYGFKSFADRTRLEFPEGITVVVGPNGSGKSNIVDAIKWVLGAQSAKNLRGKEMADVIFKGSAQGRRRPANTAEATIIFDNAQGRLDVDSPEVRITRRVFRSGEGEYLINDQPCRLRDIRDLLRGTGVGVDSYSIIEQGKVDGILQASPRDRRVIFEEAAGISRFKAKKVEAQRRLERVEQNLLRLSDIVEEVDNRLRRVKSQAGKARRYREYSERLQELRTQVGRVDWQRLSAELARFDTQVGQLSVQSTECSARIDRLQAQTLAIEQELHEADEGLRERDSRLSQNREVLASLESTKEQQRLQLEEFDSQADRYRNQISAMQTRSGDLSSQLRQAAEEVKAGEHTYSSDRQRLEKAAGDLAALVSEIAESGDQSVRRRAQFDQQSLSRATLQSRIIANRSQLDGLCATATRLAEQHAEQLTQLDEQQQALTVSQQMEAEVEQEFQQRDSALTAHADQLSQLRQQWTESYEHLTQLIRRRAAVGERATVLEEIESRAEGLSDGVQQLLELAQTQSEGVFCEVRGMVADLVLAEIDYAPLIDIALGDRAQHLVVAQQSLLDHLAGATDALAGRVGLLPLDAMMQEVTVELPDLSAENGVIGPAADFVTAKAGYDGLVQWLLGNTWLVETLHDALRLARQSPQPALRFVTRQGELVEGAVRVVLGLEKGTLGLMSRRSELVSVRKEIERLDKTIAKRQEAVEQSRKKIDAQETEHAEIQKSRENSHRQLTEHRLRNESIQDRMKEITRQNAQVQTDLGAVERTVDETRKTCVRDQHADDLLCGQSARLEKLLQLDAQRVAQLGTCRNDLDQVVTQAKIQVAKTEQRLEGLRVRLQQLTRDQQERVRALTETREVLAGCQLRNTKTTRQILAATSEVAEMYLRQQALQSQRNQLLSSSAQQRKQRQDIQGQLLLVREELERRQQEQHQMSLQAEKTRHQRATLAERLADDYGITLAALEEITEEEVTQRDRVDEEIAGLRRKISNIGTVNMDALSELDDLEQRHGELAEQYADLVAAKNSLERIIHKINADSRRLFTETLEAIRANFQVMFRKVFGGGHADIVLEEGEDILKAGIDIVATPPGKQSLGLSLLSGGERALTVVTLLLAIFEYRPSPFCVLDEVDGPLDESNIGRFVEVLNEFLQWTKFIVVTHSKKTMTAAHTLYGVTMQESGVSKRVSVRFEDVSDAGDSDAGVRDAGVRDAGVSQPSAADRSDSPSDRGAA